MTACPALIRSTMLAVGAALLGSAPAVAATARSVGERCPSAPEADVVAAIGPGSEVALVSGRRVRIVDVGLPEEPAAGSLAWLRSLVGTAVLVGPVGGPDRWGRVPARLSVGGPAIVGGAAPVDVAELLVGEGFARVDVGERDALCDPGLLAHEAQARSRRLGLWGGAAGAVEASDHAALAGRVGRFAVVEGRVVSVGERRERTYLNFGRDWARDFSVVIPRRTWAALKARGTNAEALRGRRVRVRGTLETGRAPGMEVTVPDMLEIDTVEARQR